MRAKILIMVSLAFLGCSVENPANSSDDQENTGTVKGRIVDQDTIGVFGDILIIYGTNFISSTDSSGNFIFYNIPEGSYRISTSLNSYYGDSVISVNVQPGETTFVGNIFEAAANRTVGISVLKNFAVYSKDSLLFYESSILSYRADTTYFDFSADSISLSFLASTYYSGTGFFSDSLKVKIVHNGSIVYSDVPPKGRVATGFIPLEGNDSVAIFMNEKPAFVFYRFKLMPDSASYNYVLLRTGETSLRMGNSGGYFGVNHYLIIDSLSYWIWYNDKDSIDWDIFLISDSLQDTCFWKNKNPDWGVIGDSIDNPLFSGDEYSLINRDSNLTIQFESDNISANRLPDGVYSVMVGFYDGSNGIQSGIPNLSIEMGSEKASLLDNFIQISPATPISRGEVWYAGKIYLPSRKFVPNITSTPKAAKTFAGMTKR